MRTTPIIDSAIIHFLNRFANHSVVFDSLIVRLSDTNVLKGGVIVALLWWAWFRQDEDSPKRREVLLFGLITSVFAVLVARGLALVLTFRPRPLHNPLLDFHVPYGLNPSTFIEWSAFPSDHAVLYFCLAATLWQVSRSLGVVAFCHAFLVISLPRIYLGIHYPTDVFFGALLGIAMGSFALNSRFRKAVTRPGLYWLEQHPQSFCAVLFLFSFGITEQFDSLRRFGVLAIKLLHPTSFQAMR